MLVLVGFCLSWWTVIQYVISVNKNIIRCLIEHKKIIISIDLKKKTTQIDLDVEHVRSIVFYDLWPKLNSRRVGR